MQHRHARTLVPGSPRLTIYYPSSKTWHGRDKRGHDVKPELPLQSRHRQIECRQKPRNVLTPQRRRAARGGARAAQIREQVSRRQSHADRIIGERLAGRADHCGAFFHAAAGQRNVGGDDDIDVAGALDDPVVGDVGAFGTITRSIMSLRGTAMKALATT